MKQTRLIMGMPVTLEIVDPVENEDVFERVFRYFETVDEKFSTYKENSEISRFNRGQLAPEEISEDMRTVFSLAEEFKQKTNGYFDIQRDGSCDPSGLVKGWAVYNAAEMVRQSSFENYYVEAGGDFQAAGKNAQGQEWRVGIRSPFKPDEIVKVLAVSGCGVATSGTYVRGQHIYNPKAPGEQITDIVSLTVIGPDVTQADCYATAAFAMGREGIGFIAGLDGFEGYMIDTDRRATFTRGFSRYIPNA